MAFSGGISSGWAVSPERAPHHYIYESWQIEAGLPQNFVKKITQTPDGYLWLATQEGLVRYDGQRFRTYNQFNTPAMPDPEINDLLPGATGELWIASRAGLLRLAKGEFKRFGEEAGLPEGEVTALALGKKSGDLMVGTRRGVFRLREGAAVEVGGSVGSAPLDVLALGLPGKGGLLVGTQKGLFQLKWGRWLPLLEGERRTGRGVSAILPGSDAVWVGTQGQGLYRSSGDEWERVFKGDELAKARIQGLHQDSNGAVWISTFQQGLVRSFKGETVRVTAEDGLTDDGVECAFEDREGSLWVGMGSRGLNRLRDGRFTTLTSRDGLPDEMVWSVFEGRYGAMWVGTEEGAVRYRGEEVTTFTTESGLSDNGVNAFAEDSSGRVWIGTYDGVTVIDGDQVRVLGEADGIPGHDVRSLAPGTDGGMWLGVMGGGVVDWTEAESTLWDKSKGLISDEVRVVVPDTAGGVWVGTNEGLSHVGPAGLTNYGAEQGFIGSRVFMVEVVSKTELWLGTDRGLFHFDKGVFGRISTREGLFDDKVYTILNDGLGFLWMSSNRGVFRVALEECLDVVAGRSKRVSCEVFGTMDGMRSGECNVAGSNSGWRGADGKLWFSTIAGVAMIDPSGESKSAPPKVVLEGMVVDGVERRLEPDWVSAPGVESVQINYAAPAFVVSEQVRFKYRLRGLSDQWVFPEVALGVAHYAHLAPGHYTFEVKAISGGGVESAEAASFEFYLSPFFYQTRGFFGTCLLLFLCCGFGVHRLGTLGHEKKERYLEGLVRERTEDLEVVNQQLLDLSTRDPLTGLRNRRYLQDYMEGEVDYADRQYYRNLAGKPSEKNRDILFFLIDLDHFKVVNDTWGHAAGDRVLVQAAELLSEVCRKYDRVVRWGGEEFLLVAPKFDRGSVGILAERIQSAFRSHRFDIGEEESISVTCSMGVSAYPLLPGEDRVDWEDVVVVADEAVYLAKQSGRNMWVSFLRSKVEGRRDFMRRFRSDFRVLVEEGELEVGGGGKEGQAIRREDLGL